MPASCLALAHSLPYIVHSNLNYAWIGTGSLYACPNRQDYLPAMCTLGGTPTWAGGRTGKELCICPDQATGIHVCIAILCYTQPPTCPKLPNLQWEDAQEGSYSGEEKGGREGGGRS